MAAAAMTKGRSCLDRPAGRGGGIATLQLQKAYKLAACDIRTLRPSELAVCTDRVTWKCGGINHARLWKSLQKCHRVSNQLKCAKMLDFDADS